MNQIIIYHWDEAPHMLRIMAYPASEDHRYVILVPTGIAAAAEFSSRLNIVRSQDILTRMGATYQHNYVGLANIGYHHYRVFIV